MDHRILIVGGGISGLTLGALLHQRGFRNVVIIERSEFYREEGYIIGLWGNGLRILKGIGLYKKIIQLGSQIDEFILMKHDATKLTSWSLDRVTDRFGPSVIVKRSDFIRTLFEHTNSLFPLRMGTSITSLTQTMEEVEVEFSNGERGCFDLVVAADGIWSKTRQMAGFGDVPITFWGFRAWGFWVRRTPDMNVHAVTEIWGPKGKMFGLYPHSETIIAGFCTFPVDKPNQPDTEENRIEWLRKEFAGWGGLVPQIIENIETPEAMWSGDMCELDLESEKRAMYFGRVVCVGDSGHAVLPTAGTGATLAMESAAVLADELCRCTPEYKDIQHMLLMWQMRRAPRIQRVREEGNMLATAISWSNPLAVFYRNVVASSLPGNYFSDSMMKLLYDPI